MAAARYSSQHETLLPLHLNLMADTVAAAGQTLTPLHRALNGTGRLARHTVLEINPAHAALEPNYFSPEFSSCDNSAIASLWMVWVPETIHSP